MLTQSKVSPTMSSVTSATATNRAQLCHRTVILSALLHDVGDKKYTPRTIDPTTLIYDILTSHGADPELADVVQAICGAVSYSTEIGNPGLVLEVMEKYPELAIVEDADRLDALGAVGIGRLFASGAAKTTQSLAGSMEVFDVKVLKLEGMMKTEEGRIMAAERTRRLRVFGEWWNNEIRFE